MQFSNLKSVLLTGAAVIGGFGAVPAWAQDSQDGAEDAGSGNDIIVTARRVEERLQDVPISITVFNQQALTQRNIAVATDLANYTPSLQVNQRYGPEKASYNLRGFNQDQSTAPTVGVYFAEVVGVRAQGGTTSGNSVGAGSFTDLENVQVLKGPQGTLFGRNTTGGAVLLTPKRPTDKLEGYVEGTYGNFNQIRLQGALNVPMGDTFKVRLAAERNRRDGYMKNLAGVGPDAYNDVDYFYGRASILAELSPSFENLTIVHYSDSNTNGYASKITGCATPTSPEGPLNTVAGTAGYSGTRHLQATSCVIQFARQTARGDGLRTIETSNANPFLGVEQWQVINTTKWDVSDNLTIKNIMSYGEFRERANFDLGSANFVVAGVDPSPFPGDTRSGFLLTRISPRLTTTGGAPGGIPLFAPAGTPYGRIVLDTAAPNKFNSAERTFTEELQIQGRSSDGKFNYVVGGYLEFARPIGFSSGRTGIFLNCTRPQNLACSDPLLFGSISESSTKLSFDNHGIFAQGTYNLTEQFAVTGGIRYTFDKITGLTQGTRASINSRPGSFPDPLTGISISRACTDSFRHLGKVVTTDLTVCQTNLENKSNKPTWLINLDYKPNNDLLVYAKYARGYRQGGINFTNPGVELWGPEQLDSYEIGAKASFSGAVRGYFNVAAFYNNLTDAQFFAGLTPTPAAAATGVSGGAAIVNAGSSRIQGIEVDASVSPVDGLRFDFGYSYLDTLVKQVDGAALQGDGSRLGTLLVGTPFGQILPRVATGSSFTDVPKHKLTASASYTLPLDESIGKITLGATLIASSSVVYNGAVPASVNGIPLGRAPSWEMLNLNLDWKSVGGSPVDLSVFATNVTNVEYNVGETGAWSTAGVAEVLMNPPRMFGVRLRVSFGD